MSVTVFLGGFGFGNLGDEACLQEATQRFRNRVNCCFTMDHRLTRKVGQFDYYFDDIEDVLRRFPAIEAVVLAGGGQGFLPCFRDHLDWALRCKRRGADVYIHNIGFGTIGGAWLRESPHLLEVLAEASEFSVRDHTSRDQVRSWGVGLDPHVTLFPERNLPSDPTLDHLIEPGTSVLGISINNRPDFWSSLWRNESAIARFLDTYIDFGIFPIVSTIHKFDETEHDHRGIRLFLRHFGLEERVVNWALADEQFWRDALTPSRLKHLIGRCSMLLSARKHNIVHAIGAGVPVTGIFEADNNSIPIVFDALREHLKPGSSLLPLV